MNIEFTIYVKCVYILCTLNMIIYVYYVYYIYLNQLVNVYIISQFFENLTNPPNNL